VLLFGVVVVQEKILKEKKNEMKGDRPPWLLRLSIHHHLRSGGHHHTS
jgi:hypothetical protein